MLSEPCSEVSSSSLEISLRTPTKKARNSEDPSNPEILTLNSNHLYALDPNLGTAWSLEVKFQNAGHVVNGETALF